MPTVDSFPSVQTLILLNRCDTAARSCGDIVIIDDYVIGLMVCPLGALVRDDDVDIRVSDTWGFIFATTAFVLLSKRNIAFSKTQTHGSLRFPALGQSSAHS